MTISQKDFDELKARVQTLEQENADLRAEVGPKDLTATPWHQRQVELINAFGEMAGRLEDIPGGKRASDVIIERAKREIGGAVPPASAAIVGPLLPAGSLKRGTRTPYDSSVNTVFENPPKTLQPDRFFTGVTRFDGIVAINMDPVDADAPLQVGGDGTAEILMLSNRKGLDGQNATYQHCGVFKLANDNSMGFVQNAFYRRGQRVRTDPTRRVIAVHCDSLGDLSINRGTLDGKGEEKSQALVIKYSERRQMWVIAGAWAGVGIAVRASVSTNDFGDVDSDNHPRELVLIDSLPVGP